MKCHYPDKDECRLTLFAFSWYDGGYNHVYARDKADAIQLANEAFGGGTANLVVLESTVREVDPKTYWDSLPLWD